MTVENGYVPTPPAVADYAAAEVFAADRPGGDAVDGTGRILFPGLGTGNLYDAVQRYCAGETWTVPWLDYPEPECVGVELDSNRTDEFHAQHPDADITIHEGDFLRDPPDGKFDWVLANPPFTRYRAIPAGVRDAYRDRYQTATGRFPLFAPFVEQALRCLRPGGWLTFILPLPALTVNVTEPLRDIVRTRYAHPIMYLPEETFDEQVEVILLGLKKERWDGSDHLWLEPVSGPDLQPMLEHLGVQDVDAAFQAYRTAFKKNRQLVKSVDDRERGVEWVTKEGSDGSDHRVAEAQADRQVQAGLDEWGG